MWMLRCSPERKGSCEHADDRENRHVNAKELREIPANRVHNNAVEAEPNRPAIMATVVVTL